MLTDGGVLSAIPLSVATHSRGDGHRGMVLLAGAQADPHGPDMADESCRRIWALRGTFPYFRDIWAKA